MALIDQIRGGTKERDPLAEDGVAAIQEDLKFIRIALKTMEKKTFGVLFHRLVTALSGVTSVVGGCVACAASSQDEVIAFGIVCVAIGCYLLSKLGLPWRH